MSRPPEREAAIRLSQPANDHGTAGAGKLRAKVLIPRDLPVTQMEIEVFALLLDDLKDFAANDNGESE